MEATCNVPFITTVNQVKVDREKVRALEDVKDGPVVLGGAVEEEGLTEGEGGAEVEDVVEPVEVGRGRGDVAV